VACADKTIPCYTLNHEMVLQSLDVFL